MSTRKARILLCAAAVAAAVAGGGPFASAAAASQREVVFFDATNLLLNPKTRAQTFKTLKHEGVTALRILLYWQYISPDWKSKRLPRRIDLEEPGSYNFVPYLQILEEAKRLGWTVLLTPTGPAPLWAVPGHRNGLFAPNSKLFGKFVTAAGKAFGRYVTYWGIWNEPNQLTHLLPQWKPNGSPASPGIYRALYLAAYHGLQKAGIAHPRVLFGELSPYGTSAINPKREGTYHSITPLAFLRSALCLNGHYRPVGRCAPLPMAGVAIHPYPQGAGPLYVPPNPDEVTLASIGRLKRAMDLAARAHRMPAGVPIYITEYGINTKPNPAGVTPQQQAEEVSLSEMMAWENGWIASFAQYGLRDDRIPKHPPRLYTGFQTGLEYANGRPKPLYFAFPVPLVVKRAGNGYALWGHIRPAHGPTTATVLIKRTAHSRFTVLAHVHTGPLGYWTLRSRQGGVAWKVRWISPTGVRYEGPPTGISP